MLARGLLALCGMLMPGFAAAHSFIPGAGSFVNGLVHPFVIPAHIIGILMLGMFTGQHGSQAMKWCLASFMLSVIAGLLVTTIWLWQPIQLVILVTCMLLGLGVAIARQIPLPWLVGLVAIVGFMLGLDSPQPELAGRERLAALFGTLLGCFFSLVYIAATTEILTRSWQKIGVRILGSWGAASALMVLALTIVNDA